MPGEVTISTHNGSTVAVGHNLRDPAICAHEPHIDPDGVHEVWHHEDLREFYERTFGQAQRDYDSRARGSRQIGNYLEKLTKEAAEAEAENAEIRERNKAHKAAGEKSEKLKVAKKPVYEMVIGIYAQGDLKLTDEQCREMLRLYVLGDGTPEHPSWQERNPGLRVVGIYYHADEPDGAGPHVHLDYVPVAEVAKGMAVQNSLEGALKAQGLRSGKVMCADGKERLKTAQESWTDGERDALQAVCEGYGFDVLHPQRGKKSVHKSTAEMRTEANIKALEAAAAADRAKAAEELKAAQEARQEAVRRLDGMRAAYDEGFRAFKVGKDGRTVGDWIDRWEAEYHKQLRAQLDPPKPSEPPKPPAEKPKATRRASGAARPAGDNFGRVHEYAARMRAVEAQKAEQAEKPEEPKPRRILTGAKAAREQRIQHDAQAIENQIDNGQSDELDLYRQG